MWEQLRQRLVPMRGRMVHQPDRALRFLPYGTNQDEILYSVGRGELNAALVDQAEKYETARFHFRRRCVDVDRDAGQVTIADDAGSTTTVTADLIIGADGAFSAVRPFVQRSMPGTHRQDVLEWGYREVTIPANPDGTSKTPLEALHLWPSDFGLVVAHPNADNSLTGTVLLPHEPIPDRPELTSFAELTSERKVLDFFRATFPDLPSLVPDLATQFLSHPTGQLITIRTEPWHYQDRVVLVGDACHAVYPFFGQGVSAAFEDCLLLDECLRENPADRGAALASYQRLRKPHTDVLAELSISNFVELRDRIRSPWHLARASADRTLHRIMPRRWQPLYTMVSHTTTPYGDAVRRARRQDRILTWGMGAVLAGTVAAAGSAAWRIVGRRR
jgi:kynurenine 3-monooxygenase